MNRKRKTIKNKNHPKKGQKITVVPIRKVKDIQSIKKMLESKPRDYVLFVMGINNGLRVGDLLKLKVGDIRTLKPGQTITIIESKTGKENVLIINKSVYKALQLYFENKDTDDTDYLFCSRKGSDPLTVQSVNALVKKWTRDINLKENYGAHTLRKTFGYIQRTKYGVGFEVLAKRFNHSSPVVTMRYLSFTSKEINNVLMNEI